jgi:sugar phosphate isomerase/epimerase
MIYVSTGGEKNWPAWMSAKNFYEKGIDKIELSGGIFDENQLVELKKIKGAKFQIHNYFPPPSVPFVLNLATLSDEIAERSINHIELSLQYCSELNCQFYSFHAGFLIDPTINQLGKQISTKNYNNKNIAMEVFLERVEKVSSKAKSYGIELLIENNVLSPNNFNNLKFNPFLMTDVDDSREIMLNTPSNVQLLIDVGHLKVTATTLDFEPVDFLSEVSDWVKAYHLSDNNSKSDDNNILTKDSWFWQTINRDIDYFTLEIYNVPVDTLISQIKLVEHKLKIK